MKFRSKQHIEQTSKQNVKNILNGTSKMPSRGKSGWMKSIRLDRWYHYRSSLELRALQALDEAPDFIIDFDTECFAIPYKMFDGANAANLNYIPDMILKTSNDKIYVVEIKPASQLKEDKNLAKWSAAKTWCWEHKATFIVITEKELDNLVDIVKLLDDGDTKGAFDVMTWQMI